MNSAITRRIIGALMLATATTLAQPTNAVTPLKSSVAGQEYTHPIRYEIWFPKEANKSTKEVYRVWIPEKVKQVRAVIIVPDYQNDREMYFSENLGYRQFAERMEFALMAYRIFNEDSDKTRDEATKDMLLALVSIAKTSGHPELAHASLIPTGLSWGGRCATAIALSVPERTIGFVPLHQTLTFKEISESAHKEAFFQVPGLCETAQFEESHSHDPKDPSLEASDGIPVALACNAKGAIHAGFINPGCNHPIVKAPEFIMQWITAITRKRLPSPLTFDKAPSLTPLARESGWLGTFDYEHHWEPDGKFDRFEIKSAAIVPFAQFKGDPGTAHWLPDEALAKAWKAKMGF